jgi:hypothetical protein
LRQDSYRTSLYSVCLRLSMDGIEWGWELRVEKAAIKGKASE